MGSIVSPGAFDCSVDDCFLMYGMSLHDCANCINLLCGVYSVELYNVVCACSDYIVSKASCLI